MLSSLLSFFANLPQTQSQLFCGTVLRKLLKAPPKRPPTLRRSLRHNAQKEQAVSHAPSSSTAVCCLSAGLVSLYHTSDFLDEFTKPSPIFSISLCLPSSHHRKMTCLETQLRDCCESLNISIDDFLLNTITRCLTVHSTPLPSLATATKFACSKHFSG